MYVRRDHDACTCHGLPKGQQLENTFAIVAHICPKPFRIIARHACMCMKLFVANQTPSGLSGSRVEGPGFEISCVRLMAVSSISLGDTPARASNWATNPLYKGAVGRWGQHSFRSCL